MLSIIIPTKNEEKYLPALLKSIRRQKIRETCEIIVADAKSSDKTRKIAREFGCKVVPGGNPARGRNLGARHAKGDALLFLDADCILPPDFLSRNLGHFRSKSLDVATVHIRPVPGNIVDRAMHEPFNLFLTLTKKWRPTVPSFCFIISKNLYFALGGFDESVTWFCDIEFSNRLPRNIKFDILPARLDLSFRRAKEIGRFRMAFVIAMLGIHRLLGKNYDKHYK